MKTLLCLLFLPAIACAQTQKPIVLKYETTLFFEYDKNEAAADEKFLDKKVEFLMRGKIEKVKDGSYIIGGNIGAGDGYSVVCQFAAADRAKLAKAKDGQAFQVRGICKGTSPSLGAWKGWKVTLADCELVSIMKFDAKTDSWVKDQ